MARVGWGGVGWGSYVRLLLRDRATASWRGGGGGVGVGWLRDRATASWGWGKGVIAIAADCVTVELRMAGGVGCGSYVRLLLRARATAPWGWGKGATRRLRVPSYLGFLS